MIVSSSRKISRIGSLGLVFALLFILGSAALSAEELRLDLGIEKPVLSAGQKQLTYIKVGLTGFEFAAKKDRASLNVALVLDRSGSMEGDKLDRAKQAAKYAVSLLGSDDVLSIVTYESEVQLLLPATRVADKSRILRLIDGISSDGSTALFAGVSTGAGEVRKYLSKNKVNRVILLSDGLANVGPDSPSELAELGKSLAREGISVTTIGLGLDYNEDLMTRLAQASDGNHAFVQEPGDLVRVFDLEFKDALSIVARDVDLILTCAPGVRPVGVLNREAEIQGQTITLKFNQIGSKQEKYVLIEVEVDGPQAGKNKRVADAQASYQNLQTNQASKVAAAVSVRGSSDAAEVARSLDKSVAESVVVQQAALASEKAVELRDQGDLESAKKVLQDSADNLSRASQTLNAPALQSMGAQASEDAKSLDNADDWNRQRKEMKQDQYSTQNQQTY